MTGLTGRPNNIKYINGIESLMGANNRGLNSRRLDGVQWKVGQHAKTLTAGGLKWKHKERFA